MKKQRIIVGGFIGLLPVGGVTWDYVQYVAGLDKMGHDVYYIEDTRLFPLYQEEGEKWDDCSVSVKYLQQVMEYFGLQHKWCYRDEPSGKFFGLSSEKVKSICATADIFINISCSTYLRDEYLKIPIRVLIDSDPMFTQMQYVKQEGFTSGRPDIRHLIHGHSHFFTFGENIGQPDCRIPSCGINWQPTRQPICLSYWETSRTEQPGDALLTTFMNWSAGNVVNFEGEEWGQKDVEFERFLSMPKAVPAAQFSVVMNKTGGTLQQFKKAETEEAGWKILDSLTYSGNWNKYRDFIDSSFGEFSVAKNTYVKSVCGWFSCRSACYLAMGKPVVTQDTGWSKFIPSGEGLFAFTNMASAVAAIETMLSDYRSHSVKALQVAKECFDSTKVLSKMISQL